MIQGKVICSVCGHRFRPWRHKKFCSEPCRKIAENRRLRGDENTGPLPPYPTAENAPGNGDEKQELAKALRGDERSADLGFWKAVNEITWKLAPAGSDRAIGWAFEAQGQGWFGAVGDWRFGPAILSRVKAAVEAKLRDEPVERRAGERMWRGSVYSTGTSTTRKDMRPSSCPVGG